mmetsp:Transcript_147292/g.473179  ORF Transcript_147292/g.473179 Transcript_147292/m.473179 type:complete len:220 (-) Transcript_147292:2826-3485(-)
MPTVREALRDAARVDVPDCQWPQENPQRATGSDATLAVAFEPEQEAQRIGVQLDEVSELICAIHEGEPGRAHESRLSNARGCCWVPVDARIGKLHDAIRQLHGVVHGPDSEHAVGRGRLWGDDDVHDDLICSSCLESILGVEDHIQLATIVHEGLEVATLREREAFLVARPQLQKKQSADELLGLRQGVAISRCHCGQRLAIDVREQGLELRDVVERKA